MAPFRNFLCWQPDGVNRVINIDADFVSDAVFWAVHVDVPLLVRGPDESSAGRVRTAEEVLDDFLDPNRRHYQLAVLGPTGSGKSHLIHWMRQRLETDARRVVVTVRRTETNLHAILKKLMSHLPVEKQQPFRDELERAGTALHTREAQKQTLINNLAVAIGQDKVRPESNLDGETEEALISALPSMLQDPNLRKEKFLKDGEIIDQLVERSFSGGAGRRDAERLTFMPEHLPLRDVDHKQASGLARDALHYLLMDQDRTIPTALQIINRNLDAAIALSMNFSGDRLAQLMAELRMGLRQTGRDLVLLFEEFARFQGYDAALLEALLVQGDQRICDIRWAIACTSGFYLTLRDTARSRMTAVVDMSRADEAEEHPHIRMARFAGRYLNAVRCGLNELQDAYDHDRLSEPPNKCDRCEFRGTCNAAFGTSEEGFGLYPLNVHALEYLADRAKIQESDAFNPRAFQKEILLPLLAEGGRALGAGRFPDPVLLERFGGAGHLELAERTELLQKQPDKAERYIALRALWRGRDRSISLAADIYRAFDLAPLDEPRSPDKPAHEVKPEERALAPDAKTAKTSPATRLASTARSPPEIGELEQWSVGGRLSERTAQKLRIILYRLINRAIDWDNARLARSFFSASTGNPIFGNRSIQFENQDTTGGMPTVVGIRLPFTRESGDFVQTALALQALLEYEQHGNWGEQPESKFIALLELVERCVSEVIAQIRALEGNREHWDPVGAAVELLALAAALAGRVADGGTDLDALLGNCFAKPLSNPTLVSNEARDLYTRIAKAHEQLVAFVRAHCSGTKGGDMGRFLDPLRLYAALDAFVAGGWRLVRTPEPLGARQYQDIGDLYARVVRDLPSALTHERAARLAWLVRVHTAFGEAPEIQRFSDIVHTLSEAVLAAGLNVPNLSNLRETAARFQKEGFRREWDAARTLRGAKEAETVTLCGRGDPAAAKDAEALIMAWTAVCDRIEKELKLLGGGGRGDQIESYVSRIDVSLGRIVSALDNMEGWSDVA